MSIDSNRWPELTCLAAAAGFLFLGCARDSGPPGPAPSTSFRHGELEILIAATDPGQPGIGPGPIEYVVSVIGPRDSRVETKGPLSGRLMASWVRDLDADGRFEVLLWAQSSGSGSYGELTLLEWTGVDLEVRAVPRIDDPAASGYLGHDEFEVLDRAVRRIFPVYRAEDANCCPSGGRTTMTFAYEADQLRLVNVSTAP